MCATATTNPTTSSTRPIGAETSFCVPWITRRASLATNHSGPKFIYELDTLKMEHAQEAWNKIIARNRQVPDTYLATSPKPVNTVSIFTTPEGFRFVHDRWVINKKPGYEMIQASTLSNPLLPGDYVDFCARRTLNSLSTPVSTASLST